MAASISKRRSRPSIESSDTANHLSVLQSQPGIRHFTFSAVASHGHVEAPKSGEEYVPRPPDGIKRSTHR